MQESTDVSYPLKINVFYGADLDPSIDPETFTLPSADAFGAFVRGNNEADGWMEASFLKHANYRVTADGEVREGKPPAKAALPNERFVLWGSKPDQGAKPQRYVFDDEQCAQAFEEAVMARVGWTASHFVPGTDFRAYRDMDHAREEVPEAVGRSLQGVIEKEEEYLGEDEPLFVNAKGEFVQEQWEPGQPVGNRQPDEPGTTASRRPPNP